MDAARFGEDAAVGKDVRAAGAAPGALPYMSPSRPVGNMPLPYKGVCIPLLQALSMLRQGSPVPRLARG
jgi:hypothetical protein